MDFKATFQICVDTEKKLVGKAVTINTAETVGINIDDKMIVKGYKGNGKKVLEKYINLFQEFGGDIAKDLLLEKISKLK